MSANQKRTVLLLAGAHVVVFCATQWCSAAPAASGRSQTESNRPLTREDVDLILREARSAIGQGKLAEAEALVTRAENAAAHYPFYHLGPTPASVRKELTRAQRMQDSAAPASGRSTAGEGGIPLPFARPTGKADTERDPFLARGETSPFARSLPATSQAQPLPSATPEREFGESLALASQMPQAKPAVAPAAYESTGRDAYVVPVSWDETESSSASTNGGGSPLLLGRADASIPTLEEPRMAEHAPVASSPRRLPSDPSAGAEPGGAQAKQHVLSLMASARQALEAGNLELAERLSRQATALNVPESQFLPDEDRPSLLAWDIVRATQNGGTGAASPARLPALDSRYPSTTARTASNEPLPLPLPSPTAPPAIPQPSAISIPAAHEAGATPPGGASLMDVAEEKQHMLARQLSAEIGRRQTEAQRLRAEDPERSLAILREAQQMVNDSGLPESTRRELLARIDITLEKTQKYIKDNAADIELDQQNKAALAGRDRDREMRRKLQQKIAESVEEFNRLRDEQRYAEAEIVAKRLIEMAPDDPVAKQIMEMAKFIRREMINRQLASRREDANWHTWNDVEQASFANVGDDKPLAFDERRWTDFVKNRKGTRERMRRRTERELDIERRLKTPVMLRYQDTPLMEVVDGLSQLSGVNIHLDPRGLNQEGVNSDTPVTLNLNKEISLQSALNLILEPLHLSYVIKDDVLKITSEQLRDGEIYPVTYNVSDLVIPIPNFVPSNNIGLQGLINEAHAASGFGQRGFASASPTAFVNSRGQRGGASANDHVLAQQFNAAPGAGLSPASVPIGSGPGGMGGGANADFDSLIDLIISTVATDTWAENGGGEAEIRPFPTNLSLVISQTQAVHEEIADLLEQLRRLQDLQVTIEVRFIRLNDSFFERIGIDFQMNVEDRTVGNEDLLPGTAFEPAGRRSATVGITAPAPNAPFPAYTSDLDIPFRQNSFDITSVVPFGGPVQGGLNFGFAILSDIEAYFLIEAAQGDTRTNVLNAPKVTLFNGQQAFVGDFTSRPFVVGVIPVVGEFAAAQQPVIVVLNEGTLMTIQAVVSDDRRYVRMTIVPFFTQIGNVDTFTFEGSTSTNKSSSSKDDDDDKSKEKSDSEQQVRSGVTVQLPSLSLVTVVTTVSVPDGGTVLLGGIKRLSEGRNEFGVPLLSKVPYINRLFRNVSIGRETDSLMMMVTPRIIIQEEEEERLGIAVP